MKGLHIVISENQHARLKLIAKYHGLSMKALLLTFINSDEMLGLEKKIKEKKV